MMDEEATPKAIVLSARALAVLAVVMLAVPLLMLATNAVMRVFSLGSIPGLYEISGYAVSFVGSLGFAYAAVDGGHVSTSILTSRLSGRAERMSTAAGVLVGIIVLSLTAYGLYLATVASFVSGEVLFGAEWLPIWPSRAILFIGVVAFAVVLASQVTRAATVRNNVESVV